MPNTVKPSPTRGCFVVGHWDQAVYSYIPVCTLVCPLLFIDLAIINYTPCPPKRPPFSFLNNCQKLTDFYDFWHVKFWENLTWKSYRLPISPVRCSHCTLGNPKKSFSPVLFIHTSDCLRYLTRKQSVIHLPTPPENVTTLTCELQNFFIWLKVCCVLSNVGGSEKSQLQIVIGGSEKNLLWCVATGMSGKQCHSKCSEWLPSALIHASSLFRHYSVAQYTILCWNSAHVATSRCR